MSEKTIWDEFPKPIGLAKPQTVEFTPSFWERIESKAIGYYDLHEINEWRDKAETKFRVVQQKLEQVVEHWKNRPLGDTEEAMFEELFLDWLHKLGLILESEKP